MLYRFAILIGLIMPIYSEALELSKYPTVLKNTQENLEIRIITVKKANDQGLNDAFVQIKGPAAEREGIDGEIIFHRAIPAGSGYNLQIERDNGRTFDRISSRKAWGIWTDVRVWFGGNNFRVYRDDEASQELDRSPFVKAANQFSQ